MLRVKSNPLSTRYVAPGRIAWHASSESTSLEHLVNYFTNQLNWRGAIVGPHGSGKSTLLEHLLPSVGEVVFKSAAYNDEPEVSSATDSSAKLAHRKIVWLKMRGRLPSGRLLRSARGTWAHHDCLLVIDGYEQLSLAARALTVLRTARAGAGILVTSHRTTCLKTLVATRVDVHLAAELLDTLLPGDLPERQRLLDRRQLEGLLQQYHGNLREVFMRLYDQVEQE